MPATNNPVSCLPRYLSPPPRPDRVPQFRAKFLFFVSRVARMDSLFKASFSPLASSGGGG